MIRMVRHGKEEEEETYEPVEWPPRRRESDPEPRREPTPREDPIEAPPERRREKTPA